MRQGLEYVGYRDEPRQGIDRASLESKRVALSLSPLVLLEDHPLQPLVAGSERLERLGSELRMRSQELPLLIRERAGIRQQCPRQAGHADVVNQPGMDCANDLLRRQGHPERQLPGDHRHVGRMAVQVVGGVRLEGAVHEHVVVQ